MQQSKLRLRSHSHVLARSGSNHQFQTLSAATDLGSAAQFVDALSLEYLSLALFTGVTCSMVIARANSQMLLFVDQPAGYLPRVPRVFDGLSVHPQAASVPVLLVDLFGSLYEQLAIAKRSTPSSADLWLLSHPRDQTDWRQLSDAWRRLASQALGIVPVMQQLGHLSGTNHDTRLREIGHLLEATVAGETPCVRSYGMVFVPSRLDCRRERRLQVDLTVWIDTCHGRQRAMLKDISPSGMGLSGCPSLAVGTDITVSLSNRHVFEGKISWSHGGSVGAQFATPLSDTDVRLVGVQTLVRTTRQNASDQ